MHRLIIRLSPFLVLAVFFIVFFGQAYGYSKCSKNQEDYFIDIFRDKWVGNAILCQDKCVELGAEAYCTCDPESFKSACVTPDYLKYCGEENNANVVKYKECKCENGGCKVPFSTQVSNALTSLFSFQSQEPEVTSRHAGAHYVYLVDKEVFVEALRNEPLGSISYSALINEIEELENFKYLEFYKDVYIGSVIEFYTNTELVKRIFVFDEDYITLRKVAESMGYETNLPEEILSKRYNLGDSQEKIREIVGSMVSELVTEYTSEEAVSSIIVEKYSYDTYNIDVHIETAIERMDGEELEEPFYLTLELHYDPAEIDLIELFEFNKLRIIRNTRENTIKLDEENLGIMAKELSDDLGFVLDWVKIKEPNLFIVRGHISIVFVRIPFTLTGPLFIKENKIFYLIKKVDAIDPGSVWRKVDPVNPVQLLNLQRLIFNFDVDFEGVFVDNGVLTIF